MRELIAAAVLAVGVAGIAAADPPPAGSPDFRALSPYADWVQAQRTSIGSCCDMADGRVVDYRIRDGHYEVRFRHPEDIDGGRPDPGVWYPVPPDNVLHGSNPTGEGVAWWYPGASVMQGGSPVRCFVPADMT